MSKGVKRAWEDEDDEEFKGRRTDRTPQWLQKFEGLLYEEKEAKSDSDVPEDSDDEDAVKALYGMSRTAAKYLTKSKFLPRMYLKASRVKDVTKAHSHDVIFYKMALVVWVLSNFHPTQPVLVLASKKGVSLFQACKAVDDLQQTRNDAFLQNVAFNNFPIDYIEFYDDASSIVATSQKLNTYYTYNMMNGQVAQNIYPKNVGTGQKKGQGHLVRLSADGKLIAIVSKSIEVYVYEFKTMDQIHTFMASSDIVDMCFSPTDQKKLYALTVTGCCHLWDLREIQEQKVFQDDGSFHGTVLSVSSSEQFLACGSNTGIVNVYETTNVHLSQEPKPLYTLENLTTSVDFLHFNHNSEMLAFGSADKAMAYRFLHTQSGTVFKNFPPKQEMLSRDYFTCTDISPHSGFAAFGNTNGGIRLYRLNHYEKY
ncbi:U3 small nucleolar RNA-associated protein 18-like protein [Aphelenchoides bicaudatus]|nr:U3 small nucleolar RNA-associated protein 18-like protein [Aphelenchoides bicaudatus]